MSWTNAVRRRELLFLVERPFRLVERGGLRCDRRLRGADGVLATAEPGGFQIRRELVHLRLVRVALRASLIQFLLGNHVGAAKLFAPRQFGVGQFQIGLRAFQLRFERGDFRRTLPLRQIVQLRLGLREIFFRLPDGVGLGIALQRK